LGVLFLSILGQGKLQILVLEGKDEQAWVAKLQYPLADLVDDDSEPHGGKQEQKAINEKW
jgi:hypothetical protein